MEKQKKNLVIFTVLLLLFSLTTFAQRGFAVSGIVTDEQGAPVAGTRVQLKKSVIGTSTDLSGAFRLNIPNNNRTLIS